MYTYKLEEDLDCGIRVAFKVFGGKWKLCILDAINKGKVRPTEIHKEIKMASLRVIEMQLAELLQYGAVIKIAEDAYPKKTEYELTPLGKSILPILIQIDQWGQLTRLLLNQRVLKRIGLPYKAASFCRGVNFNFFKYL
ncbi:winged helix-turn-helix transcriptional regulator [Mucilaginibacter antarcticus]|uniref:winged helix-turn-helix transcriptional regulator n=1 Tax=Mucilaginibacter antarcticus TaxID=1855725 RepID=UPI0036329CD6